VQLEATLTAAGKSVAQTAELCGVHPKTIANWRRDIPAFTAQLDEAIRERTLHFQALVPEAIAVLRNILHNEMASPSIRLDGPENGNFFQTRKTAQNCTSEPETELASSENTFRDPLFPTTCRDRFDPQTSPLTARFSFSGMNAPLMLVSFGIGRILVRDGSRVVSRVVVNPEGRLKSRLRPELTAPLRFSLLFLP
jgi:hypothetical protein